MRTRLYCLVLCLLCLTPSYASAAPRWTSLLPFKKVEADPSQSYELTEENGPWMILASSFAGPNAEQQARELVLELRSRHKLTAYLYKESYDFTEPVTGLGLDKYGAPKRMVHSQAAKFEEIAVLVGDFPSIDAPDVAKTLQAIKYMHPAALDFRSKNFSTQRYVGLRALHRKLHPDKSQRVKGPMGSAFVTRNPLLPKEFFAPGGLDPVVYDMNKDVEYSLLRNPSKYTVRVATFRGAVTLDPREFGSIGQTDSGPSKLEQAALKAHQLTVALRQQGVEAYEFHDRHESMVTVGSFDSVGTPRSDGKTELNPGIHKIMQIYGAQRQSLPGAPVAGLVPRSLRGLDHIKFDVQPVAVAVPRRSIAADYARGNSFFR